MLLVQLLIWCFDPILLQNIFQVTQNAAGAIVNKPKEMANKIISRFGSSDNLDSLKDADVNRDGK